MIGTSPPKQKPPESVTLRARIVAAAASAAFPPPLRICRPAATASAPPALTAPWLPVASEPGSVSSARPHNVKENRTAVTDAAAQTVFREDIRSGSKSCGDNLHGSAQGTRPHPPAPLPVGDF